MMDDLALMTLQAEALYVYDERGRMLHTREPDPRPAPRFFMGRTRQGNLWRCRHDVPDSLAARLDALAAAEPPAADLRQEPAQLAPIRDLLAEERPIERIWIGPAYCFPDPLPAPAGGVLLTPADLSRLPSEFAWLREEWEASAPVALSLVDGHVVAVCFCSRITPRAAEAGVETLPAHRGQGHASRAVAAWAAAVRASGRLPLYSTSWENLASQGVARRLGLRMYGVDCSLI
jgi:RimJ/RimL family protein N-acetyltransferase